jgi:hypothetical protein
MVSTTSNSSTTEPITEPSSSFTNFLLVQLNRAALRSKITTNQIEMATVALSGGLISPEQAILILAECGVEVSS